MTATAITATMIAMSVLTSGCSGSIAPPAAAVGPTANDVDAAELPYDASPAKDAIISYVPLVSGVQTKLNLP